ncbi:MAG: NADH-quinone oxidoreductase subunit K [Kouleothrix sp.]|nr:NADH-quinone oxidoreductase subunit K [Kouleothrix sp.]
MTLSPLEVALVGVLGLLGVGLYALLAARNLIKLVIALQLLGKAALLALVLSGRLSGQVNLGQSLAATALVADTIVAVLGLALAVQVRRRIGTLDVRELSRLRG